MADSTYPKPFVFVLMPFSREYDDVYKLGIKGACKEAGAYCERVDEQLFTESILDRIYNQIAKADIIVSDMSNRNPNVFYETGYAHALGKHVILLTQNADDIPFDMKHYPHIVYKSISFLKDELQRRVAWCLNNPRSLLPHNDFAPDYFVQAQKLEPGATIALPAAIVRGDQSSFALLDFSLEIYNTSRQIHNLSHYQFALLGDWETRVSVINSEIDVLERYGMQQERQNEGYYLHKKIIPPSYTDTNIIALPGNSAMYVFPPATSKILPNGWYAFKARLAARLDSTFKAKTARQAAAFNTQIAGKDCTLRILSELGTSSDINFSLALDVSDVRRA